MAQAFSSVLDSAFSLDSDIDQLSQNVNYKYVPSRQGFCFGIDRAADLMPRKQEMMMQNRELEILQAKIREAENRLQGRESTPVEEGGSSAPGPKREEQENQNGSAGEDGHYNPIAV